MSDTNQSSEEQLLQSLTNLRRIQELREQGRIQRMRDDIGCAACEYIGHTVNAEGKAIVCACTKRKMYHQIYQRAQIPAKYWDKTFEDDWNTKQDGDGNDLGAQSKTSEYVKKLLVFYARSIKKICGGFAPRVKHSGHRRDPLHSIAFEGGNKSGKSFIASVMLQQACRKGLSVYYVEWADLVSVLSNYDRDTEQDELAEIFKNTDLIAIDGVEFYSSLSPSLTRQLDRLCRARLNSGKPTLVMVSPGYAALEVGNGWKSLMENCIHVRLPQMSGM